MGREDSSERHRHERVLSDCGIDLDRFERLVEQNNQGETEYREW
jgi:hypothetical protein